MGLVSRLVPASNRQDRTAAPLRAGPERQRQRAFLPHGQNLVRFIPTFQFKVVFLGDTVFSLSLFPFVAQHRSREQARILDSDTFSLSDLAVRTSLPNMT